MVIANTIYMFSGWEVIANNIYMFSGWEVIANTIYMFSGWEVIANNIYIYYINTSEIPSELSRENFISSHVKITCYLHM